MVSCVFQSEYHVVCTPNGRKFTATILKIKIPDKEVDLKERALGFLNLTLSLSLVD